MARLSRALRWLLDVDASRFIMCADALGSATFDTAVVSDALIGELVRVQARPTGRLTEGRVAVL